MPHATRSEAFRLRRDCSLTFSICLVLAGCSASQAPQGDQAGAAASGPASTTATTAAVDEATTSQGASGSSGRGFIEIGAFRHELVISRCMTMAGALGGDAVPADGDGAGNFKLHFSFSPADWRQRPADGWEEAGSISVRARDPYLQWESGPSQVRGYNLHGTDPATVGVTALELSAAARTARGKARFLDGNALMRKGEVVIVEGSFEFNCPKP